MTIPICEIELTNRCNANCIMCPRDQMERPLGEMDFETLKLIVDKALSYGVEMITFSGFGEPLLNRNAPDYVKYVKEKCPGNKTNITTNAALLDKRLSEKLIQAGLDEIQISFNGWDKESYERTMRGLRFEEVVNNIKDLLALEKTAKRPKIIILPVLTKAQGKEDVEKIRRLLLGLGMDAGSFGGYYVCNNRSGYFMNKDIVDNDFYSRQGIKMYAAEKIVCRIPFMLNWFDWRGYAHLCCNDIKDKAILGDIKDLSFQDIENKKKEIVNKGIIPSICKNCNLPLLLGEGQGFVLVDKLK